MLGKQCSALDGKGNEGMWVQRNNRFPLGRYHGFVLYIKHTKAIQAAIAGQLESRIAIPGYLGECRISSVIRSGEI
jgi:hypothetical protein